MCQIGTPQKVVFVPKSKAFDGWRVWRVRERDGGHFHPTKFTLHSLAVQENTAWTKRRSLGIKPKLHGMTGFWSYKTRHGATQKATDLNTMAIGKVKLWGWVAVHQHGYRASQIEIQGLVPKRTEVTRTVHRTRAPLLVEFGSLAK